MEDLKSVVTAFATNPRWAHHVLFGDKHASQDAPFHAQMEEDFHSLTPKILWMMFRGAAKSTKMEEGCVLEVALQRVRNVLVLGESETRAAERLAAIKKHIESNEILQYLFDIGPGEEWTGTKAVTNTGVCIQAYGRGQSLRGVKYLDSRPDLLLIDDVEDRESGSVATPEARRKTRLWLTSTVLPAMEPSGRIRMAATPLHPEALAPTLARADKSWLTRVYPIIYKDPDTGEDRASWPDRYSVEWALKMQEEMNEIGESESFAQEYLCQAVDLGSQTFTEDMFKIEPRPRSYHPVYAVYDPARTTNRLSATTGKAVASWIGRKLVVWESDAQKWMPDKIVEDVFDVVERYSPTVVGVEENGLNEWLLQPLRAEAAKRGVLVPLRPLRAPKGKLDFIRGLQPYFRAGEVEFAADVPELRKQLLGFPTGLVDAPNALAYMLTLRTGDPVFDGFRDDFVENVGLARGSQPWLLVNTDPAVVTGVLAQHHKGRLRLLADWIMESDAGTVLRDLIEEARIVAGVPLKLMAPRHAFDDYSVLGLRPAAKKAGYVLAMGGDEIVGREEIRGLMRRAAHGATALVVSPDATWSLRAMAGGYARESGSPLPQNNVYRVLMEALEAFAAFLRVGDATAVDNRPNYAYTSSGRRYISSLAR